MKKTLVAVAVAALAATSANAAEVYNQDGTKVDIGGSIRLLLSKDKGERVDLKNDGSRFHFKASHDLGDGYSALGYLETRLSNFDTSDEHTNITVKRLYAGFAKDGVGTLTFGRQLTNLDDVGVSDYTYDLGGINQTATDGAKVVKFRSADFGGFSFGLDYLFGQKDKAVHNFDSGFGVSAFYTVALAADTKLNVEAGFSQLKKSYTTEYVKENAFLVGAELVSGPFAIGVDYSQKKHSDDSYSITNDTYGVTDAGKVRELEVGVKYSYLENASIYGEYINGKASLAADDYVKRNTFILGTDYWFTKSVVAYLEGGTTQLKKHKAGDKDRDNKVGVGFRVYF
ncbi:porin [Gallibacterium sp. AGMB14963]|uniref:porin n=1 Tax=Gallibacterium faecale TaxID=3019086 RepID=UPI0022F1541D|nr:porin [Gallibacterium sp. AGMB14963]MDA3977855.1 porin [Gallibacterium sp. AGMB14963]